MGMKEYYLMSNLTEPRRGRPNTYVLPDGITPRELIRLHIQDEMYTTSMGGVLPEQPDPAVFQRVLDVGCGTGCWLAAVAENYPALTELIGIDISEEMIGYARKQAEAHQVHERITFHLMDGLSVLNFPTDYFDLVNQRFGQSYLRNWDWRQVLLEYQRTTRPGGIVRITENDVLIDSTSPALARFNQLFQEAFYQAGHLFNAENRGLTGDLARLLEQAGLKNVQTRACDLEYRAGTSAGEQFCEDVRIAMETLSPFIYRWARLPADYNDLRAQVNQEIGQADFSARVHTLTAWGTC